MSSSATAVLEPVEEPDRAELLLHPLRQRILREAREASTAAEIARRVGLPAQKVNYHVRTLVEAGFLRPAGEGRKRNLIEKRYRATARSYVLLPRVLGEMSPNVARPNAAGPSEADRFSATHLMQLSALLQEEVGFWLNPGSATGPRSGPGHGHELDVGGHPSVPTLSIEAELRFESAEQRAAFADALRLALTDTIGRYTAPALDDDDQPRPGRPYRLVVGCYPVPDRADPYQGDAG